MNNELHNQPLRIGRISTVVAAILLVAIAALAALSWGEADPLLAGDLHLRPITPAATSSVAGDVERRLANPTLRPGFYGAPIGRQLRFALEQRTVVNLKPMHGARSEGGFDLELRSPMHLLVADRRDAEILAAVRFPTVKLVTHTTTAGQAREYLDRIAIELGEPTIVRIHASGRILGLRFPPRTSARAKGVIRGVLAAFSFVVPLDAKASWTTRQKDTTGEFRAHYRRLDGDRAIKRTKERYLSFGRDADIRRHDLRSTGQASFSRRAGWLSTATLRENMKLELREGSVDVLSRATGNLRLSGFDDLRRGDWPAVGWEGSWSSLFHSGAESDQITGESMIEIRRSDLEGITVAQLVDEIARLVTAGKAETYELYKAWDRLKWMMKLDGKAVGSVLAYVRNNNLSAHATDLLITAIGGAGTVVAQEGLISLQGDRGMKRRVRESAVVSMFQLGKPTRELMNVLLKRSRNVGSGEINAISMRAFGRLSRRSKEALDPSGRTALDHLLDMGATSQPANNTSVWIQALGNSRSERALPQTERFLESEDESLRREAVLALRHLKSSRATKNLLAKAQNDASADVRRTAIEVLAEREGRDAQRMVRDRARHDRDPSVRHSAIAALGQHSHKNRANRRVLEEVAAEDPTPELRQLAKRLLGKS